MRLIISKKFDDQLSGLKISLDFYNRDHKTLETNLIKKLIKGNLEKQFKYYWTSTGKDKLNKFVKKN